MTSPKGFEPSSRNVIRISRADDGKQEGEAIASPSRSSNALARAALPTDALIELHPVAALRGLAALLASEAADTAEVVAAIPLFGRESAFAARLRAGHLLVLVHQFRHLPP